MQKVLSIGLVVVLGACLVGCEWETSSEGDSWNDSFSWADFGGVYRPVAGKTYVVESFAPATSSPSSTGNASQSLGTGDGLNANFAGVLANTPVTLGSVTVTSGAFTLLDPEGDGTLAGDGVGTINYTTGAITANFTLAPGVGQNVLVSYTYAIAGTPANPQPGSPQAIYSISVDQTGQRLAFVDSNGMTYSGNITSMAGGDNDGTVSGAVVANFNVAGADGSKITGVLQGDYTATGGSGDGSTSVGTLNRSMQGTYASAAGGTGDVLGQAGAINVTVTSNTSTNTATQ